MPLYRVTQRDPQRLLSALKKNLPMSLTVVFFVILFVVPTAYFVARQFDKPVPFFATWIVAALIVICCLIAFIFRTVDEATGGEDGWGKTYQDIGEGKFE